MCPPAACTASVTLRHAAILVRAVDTGGANNAMALVRDLGAFGDNETRRRPLNVVLGDEVSRNIVLGRPCPRHGRHKDAIGKFETVKVKGVKQVCVCHVVTFCMFFPPPVIANRRN